ncbi:radical SAM/SPASM domain-containing protein [Candidatus Omnitrophota bacterium]
MKKLRFPKPAADQKAYNETMQKGFKAFPKRFENFQKHQRAMRGAKLDYMPIKIDIENVSRCNLNCDMCQISAFSNRKRAEDLSFVDFKRILDEQIGVYELKLQGIGEPFLQDDFIEMVRYATSKNIWVRTTTNATLLHKNDIYKKIIDVLVGEIQFSIDGATKETYERIRRGAHFEQVVENCKLINSYCRLQGVDKTRMWVLLQKDNFHELHLFPAIAKELGFKRLTISMDVSVWGSEQWAQKNEEKKISDRLAQSDVDSLLEDARNLGIDLSFWDISTKYSKDNICPWPFERAFISSDKKVVPCCMIGNPDICNIGALGSFESVWNSEDYQSFRNAHLAGAIPKVCIYCYEQSQLNNKEVCAKENKI